MELNERKRLKKKENYCSLVEDVHFFAIEDPLLANFILSSDQAQEIENIQPFSYSAQIRRLIMILEKKSKPGVLHSFCDILRATGYSWIAVAIENTDISEVPDEDVVDSAEFSSDEKLMILIQQLLAESQKHSAQLRNLNLKLFSSSELKNHASDEPLKVPCATDGWDMVDNSKPKRFVNKCVEEFMRKPRKNFSMIEKVGCILGLEVALNFSDECLQEDVSKYDGAMIEYVATMRQVVRRVAAEHADFLKDCLNGLNMRELNGYRTIDVIADVLFEDDMNVNWGRIICWFAFWGQFAKYLRLSEVERPEEFVKFYGEFIGFYLANRLHLWISGAGGWQTFVEKYREKQSVLSKTLSIARLLYDYFPLRP